MTVSEIMKKAELSKHLKKLMELNNLSARDLSKACKIPASTLSTYLSSKKASYSPEHLSSLATYFNVSVDFLLFGEHPAGLKELNSMLTENIYSGWLKVKIERAIPNANNKNGEDE